MVTEEQLKPQQNGESVMNIKKLQRACRIGIPVHMNTKCGSNPRIMEVRTVKGEVQIRKILEDWEPMPLNATFFDVRTGSGI